MTYDVIVIGGGAAGLSGALVLARSRRSVLVLDDRTPRNAPSAHAHNYLTRDGVPPGEILSLGRDEVTGYGAEVRTTTVVAARRAGDVFEVETDGGPVAARRLLVATGAVDDLPDLPGIRDLWGRHVLHCPYCHGWEVRDRRIGLLATGPLIFHPLPMWRQLSADVTLFLNDAVPLDGERRTELAARGVRTVEGKVTGLVTEGDALAGVRVGDEVVPLDALVVQSVPSPRLAGLEGLGLPVVDVEMMGEVVGTRVDADPMGVVTGVPGVWVAGNVTAPMATVVASAAAGQTAGAMMNYDLAAEDGRAALAAYSANGG